MDRDTGPFSSTKPKKPSKALSAGQSWARTPNGGGWQIDPTPTPNMVHQEDRRHAGGRVKQRSFIGIRRRAGRLRTRQYPLGGVAVVACGEYKTVVDATRLPRRFLDHQNFFVAAEMMCIGQENRALSFLFEPPFEGSCRELIQDMPLSSHGRRTLPSSRAVMRVRATRRSPLFRASTHSTPASQESPGALDSGALQFRPCRSPELRLPKGDRGD